MKALARTVWYVLTLRCEEADRVRSVGRKEDLTRAERVGASIHTALCSSCRRARKHARKIQRIVDEMGEATSSGVGLSDAARARIMESIERGE
jgi:hypothetical protein